MTPDEIKDLDGPVLTRLAWDLGLAPPERGGMGEWQPHASLDQAYAVFRQLRSHGWCTIVKQYPQAPTSVGHVSAWRFGDWDTITATFGDDPQEEARALLQVACLAVAQYTTKEYT